MCYPDAAEGSHRSLARGGDPSYANSTIGRSAGPHCCRGGLVRVVMTSFVVDDSRRPVGAMSGHRSREPKSGD